MGICQGPHLSVVRPRVSEFTARRAPAQLRTIPRSPRCPTAVPCLAVVRLAAGPLSFRASSLNNIGSKDLTFWSGSKVSPVPLVWPRTVPVRMRSEPQSAENPHRPALCTWALLGDRAWRYGTCICTCAHIYIHTHTHIYVYTHVCTWKYTYTQKLSIHIYLYTYVYIYTHVCIHVYTYKYIHICIYIYMYIYLSIYICIYIAPTYLGTMTNCDRRVNCPVSAT